MCSPTALIGNDAKGCLYHIVPRIAVITVEDILPQEKAAALSQIWKNLAHKDKTAHGVSISIYQPSPEEYLAGAG